MTTWFQGPEPRILAGRAHTLAREIEEFAARIESAWTAGTQAERADARLVRLAGELHGVAEYLNSVASAFETANGALVDELVAAHPIPGPPQARTAPRRVRNVGSVTLYLGTDSIPATKAFIDALTTLLQDEDLDLQPTGQP